MALVDVAEFTARLGRTLDATETTRAINAIEDASRLVLDVGDSTWTDVDVPDVVATVVLQVARRAFDNPDGATQKSMGDASVSYGSAGDGRSSPGALYLTKDERRAVRKAAGTTPTAVTLESPYGTYATDVWLDGAL